MQSQPNRLLRRSERKPVCDTCASHHPWTVEVGTTGIRTVVAGKGGVGKSTITALLARILARHGVAVLAVDADEQRNLAVTLGLDPEAAAAIVPLSERADYIEEKTGARPGQGAGGMLRLNPDTSDVVERIAVSGPDGVRLLAMGTVRQAAGGCLCPENSLLSATVGGMHLGDDDVVLMDTHAGVEHFGRALARGFDQALIVVDPTFNAVQVGLEAARLASELGIGAAHLAVNRVRSEDDFHRAMDQLARLGGFDFASVHALPYDQLALESEPSVDALLGESALGGAVEALAWHLIPTAAEAA